MSLSKWEVRDTKQVYVEGWGFMFVIIETQQQGWELTYNKPQQGKI